jgi:hypothetical protein
MRRKEQKTVMTPLSLSQCSLSSLHIAAYDDKRCPLHTGKRSVTIYRTAIHGGAYEECRFLGYNPPVRTSPETYCDVFDQRQRSYPGYGCAIPRTTIGFMATNSGKASVSIGTARCCKGKAIHTSELVSLWKRKKSVSLWDRSELISLRQCVRESSSVSRRNQKSQCSAVSPRRQPSQ